MIESLALKDFQKHEKLHVEFDQVTTIVGPSDAGKTAILRALAWVVENRPSGKSLMRHDTSDVRARVTVDGHTVTRVTTKSQNLYLLDQVELKAFGRGVPSDVDEIMKISPASIQRQMDGVFLLTMSPGDAAKYLNEVSGISVLDRSVKHLSQEVKTLTTKAEGIDAAQKEADEAEKASERLAKSLETLEGLKAQAEDLEALERNIAALESALADSDVKVRQVPDLDDLIGEVEQLDKDCRAVSTLLHDHSSMSGVMSSGERRIKELEDKISKIEVCPTCQRPL